MSRAWRIEFDGALYHVLSRGNEQRMIFADDQDRELFLELLGEMAARFNIDVHAYVLMGNHYHLLLKTHQANLSKCMQWFGASYTRKFNIRHKRSGHLFQGRFKNFLIESDEYLMRLSCYIHRNPLRAKIVKRLIDFRWSSYPAYAYGKEAPAWLKTDLVLSFFEGTLKEKMENYRKKVQFYSREEQALWEDLRHGLFFGSHEFVAEMKRAYLPDVPDKEKPRQREVFRFSEPRTLLKKAASALGCDPEDFIGKGRVYGAEKQKRDLLMYILWEYGVYTNGEIGDLFQVSYSAVSRNVASFKYSLKEDKALKKRYQIIKSQIKM